MVYSNPQGDGLYIVFKYLNDNLDTGAYSGSYRYKPPARTYNAIGQAKRQWQRFHNEGYAARAAEITIVDGSPAVEWIDQDWFPNVKRCKHRYAGKECHLPKDHEGIHKT